ncbi:ice-binding family protein [Thermomonas sp.]|uniref:ice-binding family protein n=1 Tax=Thermomonas sp. TaxID=1971895 RepID=UPI002488FF9A|nr:ice-binding family protein [Thermomonas sp.]MDI1254344.1 ice-binding family protein [Thermomonas sp.]
MTLLLSALVTACGGGGGGGGRGPILGAPAALAPTVIAVTPARDATNVPTNTRAITATFSEAMDPATVTAATTFTLACPTGTPKLGTVTYVAATNTATLTLTSDLPPSTTCTGTITTAAKDSTGTAMAANYTWNFTTGLGADVVPPTVIAVTPANGACLQTEVGATFSEPMNPATISTTTFTLQLTGPPLGTAVVGAVAYDLPTRVATFTPAAALQASTSYTATITTGAKDITGNALAANRTWTFVTGTLPCTPAPPPPPPPPSGSTAAYGILAGTAGTTNMGTLTVVNGSLATTATTTSAVTGFHDAAGDIYTETPLNRGTVTGNIRTCTVSTTGPTSAAINPANCTLAQQAKLDAEALYLSLSPAALPGGTDPGGGQLGGLTLAPGVYKAAGGSFLLTGADLTLDAGGNPNAVWVFQTASSLTVGAPAAPRSIIMAGGAQFKNVYWRVGSAATINAAGGGTMVGNILASAGVSVSTAGNVAIVTLEGRATSLNASVTVVNTVINVPAP